MLTNSNARKYTVVSASSHYYILCEDKASRKNIVMHYEQIKTRKSKKQQFTDNGKVYLNIVQRNMFRKLMYGVQDFSAEQLHSLSTKAIEKIESNYRKAKKILHIYKAKKYYEAETKLLNAIFPHVNLGSIESDWIVDLPKNETTLNKLKISTKEVVDLFISHKLLPTNFYEITNDGIKF